MTSLNTTYLVFLLMVCIARLLLYKAMKNKLINVVFFVLCLGALENLFERLEIYGNGLAVVISIFLVIIFHSIARRCRVKYYKRIQEREEQRVRQEEAANQAKKEHMERMFAHNMQELERLRQQAEQHESQDSSNIGTLKICMKCGRPIKGVRCAVCGFNHAVMPIQMLCCISPEE